VLIIINFDRLDGKVGGWIIAKDNKIKQIPVEGAIGIDPSENVPIIRNPGIYEIKAKIAIPIAIPFSHGNNRLEPPSTCVFSIVYYFHSRLKYIFFFP
jgi:hypothetical protein